jgi:hypothetical protein
MPERDGPLNVHFAISKRESPSEKRRPLVAYFRSRAGLARPIVPSAQFLRMKVAPEINDFGDEF